MQLFRLERETGQTEMPPGRRQEMRMQPNDLTAAKINATLKILEWARGDIEPGIGNTPQKAHIALAEAFREIYGIVDEAIKATPNGETGLPDQTVAVPIGEKGQSS
jgi:hypothetical protein